MESPLAPVSGFAAHLARVQIGPVRLNSSMTQVVILGAIAFCSVGMFSACLGLGAGGLTDVQLADKAYLILSCIFAVAGFFAGSAVNTIGLRASLCLGSTGYVLYIGSLWAYQVHHTKWFFLLAAAILGLCASLLWSAQGAIMMSYPAEHQKGRAFSTFWSIFQAGTLVGSAVALGILANSTLRTMDNKVYLAFIVIMLLPLGLSWLILPPQLVVRTDGSVVQVDSAVGPMEEIREFVKLLRTPKILLMFPMFFISNFFYVYQGAVTVALFNARTRALVSLVTGLGSILGSLFIGTILDKLKYNRCNRARIGLAVLVIIECAIWTGGTIVQTKFERPQIFGWDWSHPDARGPIAQFMFYYIADAAYQGFAYWTMSATSNDPYKLARLAGFYKGVQAAGSAAGSAMDAVMTPYMTELAVSWSLTVASLIPVIFVLNTITDSNYEVEGVAFVDDVIKPTALPILVGDQVHAPNEVDEKYIGTKNGEKDVPTVVTISSPVSV